MNFKLSISPKISLIDRPWARLTSRVHSVSRDPRPEATVDFFRDGAAVAENHPKLDASLGATSIPVVAAAKLPVGDYQARVTVRVNGRDVHRWTAFTVTP